MSVSPAIAGESLRLSVAPMMDWTDTHCRVFHRIVAPHARLYTEMVHANAVIHGDRSKLLALDPVEHPVALQLGGSEPELLAQAARIGAEHGFDEINLNCGCPSDRSRPGASAPASCASRRWSRLRWRRWSKRLQTRRSPCR